MSRPLVTVLIPARNEGGAIAGCLAAVLAQSWPREATEVLVVDGGSTDDTAARAEELLAGAGLARWKVVANPAGNTPSNLNRGLSEATGELLCRVDARSIVPDSYVSCCVEVLESQPEVVVTGGAQVAIARGPDPKSVGIARALNNRYAMGGARYRRGAESGPTDTVYLGAFRTTELRNAGGWNERYHTNQDFELNRRMGRTGTVFFDARLAVGYLPRTNFVGLWQQYRRFGAWKVAYWREAGDPPRMRQLALLTAPPVGVVASIVWMLVGRPWRRARLLALIAFAGLGLVEAAGSSGPRGGLRARICGAVGVVVVAVGWTTGVWSALVGRGGR